MGSVRTPHARLMQCSSRITTFKNRSKFTNNYDIIYTIMQNLNFC